MSLRTAENHNKNDTLTLVLPIHVGERESLEGGGMVDAVAVCLPTEALAVLLTGGVVVVPAGAGHVTVAIGGPEVSPAALVEALARVEHDEGRPQ